MFLPLSPKWTLLWVQTVSDFFLLLLLLLFFFFFLIFLSFRAAPMAYGISQARGPVGATAAGLHQSHSNAGSELCLQPTPQLKAMPDP